MALPVVYSLDYGFALRVVVPLCLDSLDDGLLLHIVILDSLDDGLMRRALYLLLDDGLCRALYV